MGIVSITTMKSRASIAFLVFSISGKVRGRLVPDTIHALNEQFLSSFGIVASQIPDDNARLARLY